MPHKPLYFRVLCILFLLEPIVKLVYFKVSTDFSFLLILDNVLSRQSFYEIFSFWLAFPLAGLCLVKIRNWSYFIFLYLLIFNASILLTYDGHAWPYNSESPLLYHYVLFVLSIIVAMTFLLPVIREPFFNKKTRWWETRKRFKLQWTGAIFDEVEYHEVWIENISYSGVLLRSTQPLHIGENLYLRFSYGHFSLSLPIRIVRSHDNEGVMFGASFCHLSLQEKIDLFLFIVHLEKSSSKNQQILA